MLLSKESYLYVDPRSEIRPGVYRRTLPLGLIIVENEIAEFPFVHISSIPQYAVDLVYRAISRQTKSVQKAAAAQMPTILNRPHFDGPLININSGKTIQSKPLAAGVRTYECVYAANVLASQLPLNDPWHLHGKLFSEVSEREQWP